MKCFRLSCLLIVVGFAAPADAFDWFRPLGSFQSVSKTTHAPTLVAPISATREYAASEWFSWRPQVHCWNLKCRCRPFRDMFSWSGFRGHGGCSCAGGSHVGEIHEGEIYEGGMIESDEPAAPPVPEPAAESTTGAWELWPRSIRLLQVPLGT